MSGSPLLRHAAGGSTLLAALYWLAAAATSVRAYAVAFQRYQPHGEGDVLGLVVARDAGLGAATATAAGALVLFLAILALRAAGGRLASRDR